jgi:arylsulfatase
MGYSDIAPFGGEIDTPALADLAADGYRLGNYQTPPMCAPARAALMTGMNPHRAGFAFVPHMDPGFPNSAMEIPQDAPTLAENFRAGGYATFMVGKWHLTLESKMHDGADKASWPLQRGFDRYYGCMDGFTSLFHPHRLVHDNSQLVIDEYPEGYYLTDDLTNHAIAMVSELRANDSKKPFFLYFAHTAVHGPVQAKAQDIEKYRGRYEAGWDHIRSQRFARQVQIGLFPEGTRCAPRNTEPGADVVPWDGLSAEQRSLFARYMEAYAAAVDNVDQNLRRLIDHLKALGEYENTIIVFTSDNGGTSEGGDTGTRSYFSRFSAPRTALPQDWRADVPRDPDLIGGPRTYVHYPRGWAYASNTPFRLYKTFAHGGGVRVPMVVSWPAGLPKSPEDDGIRSQYAYATDVGPTLMRLAGVRPLVAQHGMPAREIDGVPFDAWLRDATAPTRHMEQYTELNGRRAFIDGNWKALSPEPNGPGWDDAMWELYDVAADPTETTNVASVYPEKVRELAERWTANAWWNQVFPLNDDGSFNRNRPATELILEEPVTLLPGTSTLERYRSAKLIRLRSFTVDVLVEHGPNDAGVLVAHGDQGGGYVLHTGDGQLVLAYNEYGEMHRVKTPLKPGIHRIRLSFEALPEYKWTVRVEMNGLAVAELADVFQLTGMAPFAGISVGLDRGGPVDWDLYTRHGCHRYSGLLRHVQYIPGPKADYNPEQILELDRAMAAAFE